VESKVLNLEGIPEPIARALEVVAELARQMARRPKEQTRTAPELPVWTLGVIGPLDRDAVYDE